MTEEIHPDEGNAREFRLNTIYFYLCGDCNLACKHCWISPSYQKADTSKQSLDYSLFTRIITQGIPLGLTSIKLTGGEPLIHPRIMDIIGFVRDQDLSLTVETNGVSVTEEIASRIKECKNPFVSVSLDGTSATHERIRGVKGSYDRACNGARILAGHGLRPQIIMTMMRENKDQVRDVISLAEELGAGSVKFNFVQPTERGAHLHETGDALNVKELIDLSRWIQTDCLPHTGIRLYTSLPPAFRSLSSLFSMNGGGCGVCNIHHIMGVLSDGSYALCGIGQSIPELVFGDARTVELADVWKNDPVLNVLREELPRDLTGICGECVMKWRCLGSCIAQNYYRTHDLLADYWFCHIANETGLFPENRKLPLKKAGT